MAKIRYLLFAVLVTIAFLNGNCRRPPPIKPVEEWGSIGNFSEEKLSMWDPYVSNPKGCHAKGANWTAFSIQNARWDAESPTTPIDPYDYPHVRLISVYNHSPKPIIVYRLRHAVDDSDTPYPAYITSLYDFEVKPHRWSDNRTISDEIQAHKGKDEFGIILGYEGRNLTSKKDLKFNIPRMLARDVEIIQVIVDMPKNLFRVKPHNQPIRGTHLIDYYEPPFKIENYDLGRGAFRPL